jgi:phosphoglucan,water dikinase
MKSDVGKTIRIGNQTAYSAPSITQPFEYAVSNGFDAFELFPDKTETGEGWTSNDLSKETRAQIEKAARDSDIRLSVHVPWRADPLRVDGRLLVSEAVELAEDVGAALINVHFLNRDGPASYAKAILGLLKQLMPKRIGLSIENTPDTGPRDVNRLFEELGHIGSIEELQVGMCLDLGHANLCEETRNDYLKFIDLLDARVPIVHVHLHENYGNADSHLLLFTGPAGRDDSGIRGFLRRMRSRRFSGSIIFEQWPNPPSLLNRARDRLLEMLHDLEQENKTPVSADVPGKSIPSQPASSWEAEDFALEIANADRRFHSWRKKLAWIDDGLENEKVVDMDHLVYLAIYFRFMGTGLIRFGEDGGHYRPSHHADIARRIHERLSAVATPENIFILRKIYPWLPSFQSAFTHAEPLTRIRDIAHRSDIPHELKSEIKSTLQNKLHRSAGPEDLETSKQLLERIIAPDANYSPDFVAEFRQFHKELMEFFNARPLEEQLRGLSEKEEGELSTLIRKFLSCKEKTETLRQQLYAFEALSRLRARLNNELKKEKGSKAQELQLADIKLEDYGFILLSRLVNNFESAKNDLPREQVLTAVGLSVRNLRFSGFDASECTAIESELQAWNRELDVRDRVQLIRLKATIERARRLAETYCSRILTLYPKRVQRLGRLLEVEEQSIKIFAEADIRIHPVFQLSRLVAVILKEIKSRASLPLWEVIVPGTVCGRLMEVSNIGTIASSDKRPVIFLLERVEGDEEIPPGVVSLVVARDTPHLSHLAVRARQAGVVFIVCEDRDRLSQLKKLSGQYLLLEAFSSRFDFSVTPESDENRVREEKTGSRCLLFDSSVMQSMPSRRLIPMAEITASFGGRKAFAARRLQEMTRYENAGFQVPEGMVIPFGVMEEVINSNAASARRYSELLRGINGLSTDSLLETARELKIIIEKLPVPEEILSRISQSFPRPVRLMVRSSSNAEDLKDLSGAGQFASVANVGLRDVGAAVLKVWASIWTCRAVRSRQNLAIPHERIRMAVLIQKMAVPDKLSFIMHTVNPVNLDRDEAYVELAVGMGETLALAETEGTPYRIACRKEKESVRILSFADFSRALWPGSSGQLVGRQVNYSTIEFSTSRKYRQYVGYGLGRIARFVEDATGQPQDIEGVISRDIVYLVQTRPQQGRVQ